MRLAAYNVENLFNRAKPMNLPDRAEGARILEAEGELSALLQESTYTLAIKQRIVELLTFLGLARTDTAEFVVLRRIRGALVRRPRTGGVEVVADGRSSWIGWVELKTDRINEVAVDNTARVIRDIDADVVGVVEAEGRITLNRFAEPVLRTVDDLPLYPHVMVIDLGDPRTL